jgi:hypothetical protein
MVEVEVKVEIRHHGCHDDGFCSFHYERGNVEVP